MDGSASSFDSRGQRAECLQAAARRLPRGPHTPLQGSGVADFFVNDLHIGAGRQFPLYSRGNPRKRNDAVKEMIS